MIFLHFETIIPFHLILFPDDRDFLFHLVTQTNLTLFAHIIDHRIIKVLVRNTSGKPLYIFYQQRLSHTINIYYNNCFFTKAKSALYATVFLSKALLFFEHEFFYTLMPSNLSIKTRLNNGVRVYGDKHIVTLLAQLITKKIFIW